MPLHIILGVGMLVFGVTGICVWALSELRDAVLLAKRAENPTVSAELGRRK